MTHAPKDMRRRARMVGIALLATGWLVATPALAGSDPAGRVTLLPIVEDDDHIMQTWLGVPMRRYAFGMRRWLEDGLAAHGGRAADAAELLRFQQQLRRATFSHFQYSYTLDGTEYTRIYLGVSGRPFPDLVNASYRGPRNLVVPANVQNYFNTDDIVSFGSVGPVDGSHVTPEPPTANTPHRTNDAEIKVLQAIMRDIASGQVRAGGRLLGFVSQVPCASCSAAFRQFATEADADVHINYVEGSPNSSRTMTPALAVIRSMRHVLVDELTTTFAPPTHVVRASAEVEGTDEASTSMCPRL